MRIKWLTRKVKTLFTVKDKYPHHACKICKDVCSCVESYIGETVRNAELRWNENASNASAIISKDADFS